jgi:uncharacterized repeat protein (TIGR03803 family)
VPTALVRAADGNFYGTNSGGGAFEGGTVFKLTPGGTLTTLYSFCAQDPTICIDGAGPQGLTQGTDGNFYGTTFSGGANGHGIGQPVGTVFRITPGGTLTTLHSFCARTNCTDGIAPAGLIQATSGTFYGGTDLTSSTTGNSIGGTIFSLCVGVGWFVEMLPSSGTVGSTVKILGTDLTGATHVSFAGITAPFTIISPTETRPSYPKAQPRDM